MCRGRTASTCLGLFDGFLRAVPLNRKTLIYKADCFVSFRRLEVAARARARKPEEPLSAPSGRPLAFHALHALYQARATPKLPGDVEHLRPLLSHGLDP